MGAADVKGIGLANASRAWWGFPRETKGVSLAPRAPASARATDILTGPGDGCGLLSKSEKGYNLGVPAGPDKKIITGAPGRSTRASREAGPSYSSIVERIR